MTQGDVSFYIPAAWEAYGLQFICMYLCWELSLEPYRGEDERGWLVSRQCSLHRTVPDAFVSVRCKTLTLSYRTIFFPSNGESRQTIRNGPPRKAAPFPMLGHIWDALGHESCHTNV